MSSLTVKIMLQCNNLSTVLECVTDRWMLSMLTCALVCERSVKNIRASQEMRLCAWTVRCTSWSKCLFLRKRRTESERKQSQDDTTVHLQVLPFKCSSQTCFCLFILRHNIYNNNIYKKHSQLFTWTEFTSFKFYLFKCLVMSLIVCLRLYLYASGRNRQIIKKK